MAMMIDEAIEMLKKDKEQRGNCFISDALDMAIKALEQEQTTNNDLVVDCISRTEVLNLIYDYKENHSENRKEYPINYGTLLDMIRWIRKLPSVTPQEPRKGHWIGHREHCENLGVMPSGLGVYEWCSNCDCGIDVREWHRNNYNFCPNCGADMREVEE